MYNYGGFPISFWNDLGNLVKPEDPYDRIMGAHPTPPMWDGGAEAPQWSTAETVHDQKWVDYNPQQIRKCTKSCFGTDWFGYIKSVILDLVKEH